MRSRAAGPAVLALVFAVFPAREGLSQGKSFSMIQNTPHNLSASGRGKARAARESRVCVFCHTPHGSGLKVALWNRSVPQGPYTVYRSSSLRADVGQPTGVSKLCLSCHDGTVALGHVLSQQRGIAMAGGVLRMPAGPKVLGTDLSDDHPISFRYATSLAGDYPKLLPENEVRSPVRLDENGELQCTSCHFAHDNTYGAFLVRSNESGELCLSCHNNPRWPSSTHATSTVQVSPNVAATLGAEETTLSENACRSCHRPHTAPGPAWLLHRESISDLCLECHDGRVAPDVRRDNRKTLSHGLVTTGPPGTAQGLFVEGDRISCSDCHDPHATGTTPPGSVPSSLAGVAGVSLAGTPVSSVRTSEELCFRCHGDAAVQVSYKIDRIAFQPNTRLQFQPTNPSYHPVGNPGVNGDVPSLIPPLLPNSQITCGDCHDSDSSQRIGGSGPAGPHGSIFAPILARRYETRDFTQESPEAYALCYSCHYRDSILRDESFSSHRKHVEEAQTPCSVCHDPHGINSDQGSSRNHSHLMNFDRSVVFPSGSGRLEFEDLGRYRGRCYLTCHGENHDPLEYGD